MKKLKGAETKLERSIQRICNSHAGNYDNGVTGFLNDLFYSGCQSGIVGELVYYNDTLKFYKTHRTEIVALLKSTLDETGFSAPSDLFGDKWDNEDFFCEDTNNKNLLAWFAFEETARILAGRNGIEV